jgi:hypothetical protein
MGSCFIYFVGGSCFIYFVGGSCFIYFVGGSCFIYFVGGKGLAVPAPHVTPVVFLLNDTNIINYGNRVWTPASYKKQELLTIREHLGSPPVPSFFVGSMLNIFVVFCVALVLFYLSL